MARICFVLVAGLDQSLLEKCAATGILAGFKHGASFQPVLPAVTSTMQATLTTGVTAAEHGIICNGLYTHDRPALQEHLDLTSHAQARRNVSFWEQSNSLLEHPRFWQNSSKKVAMLFWQNSMPAPDGSLPAADVVITPKPRHTPDGKTLTACWSAPDDLYATLAAKLGPFPLHNYWSPMAGLPSSQWIVNAAQYTWEHHAPDLQLVYIPHLDFNLLRLGPNHPAILKDLAELDTLLTPLAAQVRATGGTLIVAGDYAMNYVSEPVLPNRALRQAGLLITRPDAAGKLEVDYDNSSAFAMVDHQIAHIYTHQESAVQTADVLAKLPGLGTILSSETEIPAAGLNNPRSGNLIALAGENAWFAHDWWFSDAEKPAWQFTVDIHSKPGFDPRELFFDREKKCIAQNLDLPRGSHGLITFPTRFPVLLSDAPLPVSTTPTTPLSATHIAPWLKSLL